MQGSTHPNKAFWEAVTLIAILLAVLLFSVCHLKGWLGRSGRHDDSAPSDETNPAGPGGNGTSQEPVSPAGTINTPATATPGSGDGGNGGDGNNGDGGGGDDQPPRPPRDGGQDASGKGPGERSLGGDGRGEENGRRPRDEQTLRFSNGTGNFYNFPDLEDSHVEITMEQLGDDIPPSQDERERAQQLGTSDVWRPQGFPYGRPDPLHVRSMTHDKRSDSTGIKSGLPESARPQKHAFDFLPWDRPKDPKDELLESLGMAPPSDELKELSLEALRAKLGLDPVKQDTNPKEEMKDKPTVRPVDEHFQTPEKKEKEKEKGKEENAASQKEKDDFVALNTGNRKETPPVNMELSKEYSNAKERLEAAMKRLENAQKEKTKESGDKEAEQNLAEMKRELDKRRQEMDEFVKKLEKAGQEQKPPASKKEPKQVNGDKKEKEDEKKEMENHKEKAEEQEREKAKEEDQKRKKEQRAEKERNEKKEKRTEKEEGKEKKREEEEKQDEQHRQKEKAKSKKAKGGDKGAEEESSAESEVEVEDKSGKKKKAKKSTNKEKGSEKDAGEGNADLKTRLEALEAQSEEKKASQEELDEKKTQKRKEQQKEYDQKKAADADSEGEKDEASAADPRKKTKSQSSKQIKDEESDYDEGPRNSKSKSSSRRDVADDRDEPRKVRSNNGPQSGEAEEDDITEDAGRRRTAAQPRPPPRRQQAYTEQYGAQEEQAYDQSAQPLPQKAFYNQAVPPPPPVPQPNESRQQFQQRVQQYQQEQAAAASQNWEDGSSARANVNNFSGKGQRLGNWGEDREGKKWADSTRSKTGKHVAENKTRENESSGSPEEPMGGDGTPKKLSSKEKREAKRRQMRDQYMEDAEFDGEDDSEGEETALARRRAEGNDGKKKLSVNDEGDDLSADESDHGTRIRRRRSKGDRGARTLSVGTDQDEPEWVTEKRLEEEREMKRFDQEDGALDEDGEATEVQTGKPETEGDSWARARRSKRRAGQGAEKKQEQELNSAQKVGAGGNALVEKTWDQADQDEAKIDAYLDRQRREELKDRYDAQSSERNARIEYKVEPKSLDSKPLVQSQERPVEEALEQVDQEEAKIDAYLGRQRREELQDRFDAQSSGRNARIEYKVEPKSLDSKSLVQPQERPNTENDVVKAASDESKQNKSLVPTDATEKNHVAEDLPPVPRRKDTAARQALEDDLFESGVHHTPLPEGNGSELRDVPTNTELTERERKAKTQKEKEREKVAEGLPPVPRKRDTVEKIEMERELQRAGVYTTPLPDDDSDLEDPDVVARKRQEREGKSESGRDQERLRIAEGLPPVPRKQNAAERAELERDLTQAGVYATPLPEDLDEDLASPRTRTRDHGGSAAREEAVPEPAKKAQVAKSGERLPPVPSRQDQIALDEQSAKAGASLVPLPLDDDDDLASPTSSPEQRVWQRQAQSRADRQAAYTAEVKARKEKSEAAQAEHEAASPSSKGEVKVKGSQDTSSSRNDQAVIGPSGSQSRHTDHNDEAVGIPPSRPEEQVANPAVHHTRGNRAGSAQSSQEETYDDWDGNSDADTVVGEDDVVVNEYDAILAAKGEGEPGRRRRAAERRAAAEKIATHENTMVAEQGGFHQTDPGADARWIKKTREIGNKSPPSSPRDRSVRNALPEDHSSRNTSKRDATGSKRGDKVNNPEDAPRESVTGHSESKPAIDNASAGRGEAPVDEVSIYTNETPEEDQRSEHPQRRPRPQAQPRETPEVGSTPDPGYTLKEDDKGNTLGEKAPPQGLGHVLNDENIWSFDKVEQSEAETATKRSGGNATDTQDGINAGPSSTGGSNESGRMTQGAGAKAGKQDQRSFKGASEKGDSEVKVSGDARLANDQPQSGRKPTEQSPLPSPTSNAGRKPVSPTDDGGNGKSTDRKKSQDDVKNPKAPDNVQTTDTSDPSKTTKDAKENAINDDKPGQAADPDESFVANHRAQKDVRVGNHTKKKKRTRQARKDDGDPAAAADGEETAVESGSKGNKKEKRKKKKKVSVSDEDGDQAGLGKGSQTREDDARTKKRKKRREEHRGKESIAEEDVQGQDGEEAGPKGFNVNVDVNAADVVSEVLEHRKGDVGSAGEEASPDPQNATNPQDDQEADPATGDTAPTRCDKAPGDATGDGSSSFKHEARYRGNRLKKDKLSGKRVDSTGHPEDVDLHDDQQGRTTRLHDVEDTRFASNIDTFASPDKAFSFRSTTWWTLRQTGHVLRHSPFLSLITFAAIVAWVEGTRQIANVIVLASGGSVTGVSPTALAKRGLNADLEFTSEKVQSNESIKGWSVQGLFIVLNCWIFVSILIVGLLFNWTVKSVDKKPGDRSWWRYPKIFLIWLAGGDKGKDAWWRHPGRTLVALVLVFEPILMGAKLSGPITFARRAGWYTYARITLFLGQAITTILLVRQAMSLVYLVTSGSPTTFSTLPDLKSSETALVQAAKAIPASYALIALFLLLGICILTQSFACYALFNPRARPRGKNNSTIILMLQLIASVVIISAFFGIMYFFGEITSFASNTGEQAVVYGKNFVIANLIIMVSAPALGWRLVIIWRVVGKMRSGSGDGGPNWGCATLDCSV